MTVALTLIGVGSAVSGTVGVFLPRGERLTSLLALVVGAGVGLASVAVGSQFVDGSYRGFERVFLMASSLGFAATVATLALLWRTVRCAAGLGPDDD